MVPNKHILAFFLLPSIFAISTKLAPAVIPVERASASRVARITVSSGHIARYIIIEPPNLTCIDRLVELSPGGYGFIVGSCYARFVLLSIARFIKK